MRPVIYCASVDTIPNGGFGWAGNAADEGKIERHRGGTETVELVDGLADDLAAGQGVALGLEYRRPPPGRAGGWRVPRRGRGEAWRTPRLTAVRFAG